MRTDDIITRHPSHSLAVNTWNAPRRGSRRFLCWVCPTKLTLISYHDMPRICTYKAT